MLSPVCCCDLDVIEIPIYNQHLRFSKQMCVFLCLQWSLVVATITEIPPLVFLPNFLVQRKVLRPLRTQTGGTIMVGPSENFTHTAEQNDFKTFSFSVMFQCCSFIFSADVTFLPLFPLGEESRTIVVLDTDKMSKAFFLIKLLISS